MKLSTNYSRSKYNNCLKGGTPSILIQNGLKSRFDFIVLTLIF